MARSDYELVAQQVSDLTKQVAALEARLSEVESVNARLEAAALTTSRALGEISRRWTDISRHWDAVYEAMHREEPDVASIEDLQQDLLGLRSGEEPNLDLP